MPPSRIELLQRMPVFGAMREDILRLLLAHVREVHVDGGGYFFRENDAASSMFVLESGHASVLKDWQGKSFLLRSFDTGDCFGEMALMDLLPRSAAVRADTDCDAIEIASADLFFLFEHDVEQFALLQMNLAREVCRRLRHTDDLLFRARMGDPTAVPESVFGAH